MQLIGIIADINRVIADVQTGAVTKSAGVQALLAINSRATYMEGLEFEDRVEISDMVEGWLNEWGAL